MNPKAQLALLLAAIAAGVGVSIGPSSPVPQVLDNTGNALSGSLASTPPSGGGTAEFPTTTGAGPSTSSTAGPAAAAAAAYSGQLGPYSPVRNAASPVVPPGAPGTGTPFGSAPPPGFVSGPGVYPTPAGTPLSGFAP